MPGSVCGPTNRIEARKFYDTVQSIASVTPHIATAELQLCYHIMCAVLHMDAVSSANWNRESDSQLNTKFILGGQLMLLQ